MSIRYTPRARREVRQAWRWWRENRPAATDVFEAELRRAFELLLAHPQAGQPIASRSDSARLRNVRRLYLSQLRYFVYYRADDTDILVLALWHTSRGAEPGL